MAGCTGSLPPPPLCRVPARAQRVANRWGRALICDSPDERARRQWLLDAVDFDDGRIWMTRASLYRDTIQKRRWQVRRRDSGRMPLFGSLH